MAEAIGAVIGTIIAILILLAIPAIPIWLIVRAVKRRKSPTRSPGGIHRAQSTPTQATSSGPVQIAPGWYPDPQARGALRWWTGTEWGPTQNAPLEQTDPAAMSRYGNPIETAEARATQDRELAERFRKKEPHELEPAQEITRVSPVNESTFPLFDRQSESEPLDFGRTAAVPSAKKTIQKVSHNSSPKWVPAGQSIEVAGYTIDGGLLYAGHSRPQRYDENEPSLIDPNLKVNSARPDYAGNTFTYWPSYDSLKPEARAAYLEWLSHGRRDSEVPIGYVFLFMYGLETRVLVDIANDSSLTYEVPAIRTEMQELLALHEHEHSFQSYGSNFLDVLDLLAFHGNPELQFELPDLSEYRWNFPLGLKVQLGSFAADGAPVSSEWALAWAWFNPGTRLRTPATRCFVEFSTYFKTLYTEAHGEGLIAKPGKRKIKLSYHAATSTIGSAEISIDGIADVSELSRITSELERIVDQAQDGLDSYSRFIGKNPNALGSLKAQALLPAELLDRTDSTVAQLADLMATATSNASTIVATKLIELWNGAPVERLPKSESIQICQLAEKLGFGLEPDPRFGGPVFEAETKVTIFDVAPEAPVVSSPEFAAALTLTHLAIVVSAADGLVGEAETATLFSHVESSLGLTGHERTRLEAHARWLVASGVKLTGLSKRLTALTDSQRDGLGRLLIDVAVVDGVVTPDEVRTIGKIYKLLNLDESVVTSRLHQAMTGSPALRDEPVIVRHAELGLPGSPVPARPASAPGSNKFSLNDASIEEKLRDTAMVSALLQDIFEEDAPKPAPGRRVATSQENAEASPVVGQQAEVAEEHVAGLDAKHSTLFREVTHIKALSRGDFDALCEDLGLLPNGALDTLNDAAVEVCDEPLVDGDEDLTINQYALEEMLQ